MLRLCGAASHDVHHTSHPHVSGCKLHVSFESCRASLEHLDMPKCLGGREGR